MHYIIIGNGVAGTTAAFTLRKRDARARITMISGESEYFFSRTALMYAYMDRMNLRDLEPVERKVFDAQRIERRRGWVTGLDATRRSISFADGSSMEYGKLLLATGSVPNWFPWRGLELVKEGVTHFVSLQHLAECERLTPSTRRAVVVGGGLIGVELVECLVHHGIEVDFLIREPSYWPIALSAEEGKVVAEHIRRHGVRLRLEEETSEVFQADGRVSGVRTKKGEEITCQMLGVCIGVRPCVEWLEAVKTPPALGRGIQISADFRSSLPDVWAAGDCAEFQTQDGRTVVEQIWYSAKRQGELAGRAMLGDKIAYQPPLFYNSAKFFEIEYTTAGQVVRLPETATAFSYRVPGKDVTIRIVEDNGAVIGFNTLGSRWNHAQFETWIRQRRTMDDVMTQLHLAQFDVEFGRLPLDGVRDSFARWRRSGQGVAA